MNSNDNNKTLRISFQAVLIGVMVLNLLSLNVPDGYTARAVFLALVLAISCATLIYIMVRVCFKNVKRWEMVLYNVLNLICICLIVYCIRELAFETMYVQRENAIDYDEYDDAEGIGLSAMFVFVLLGIPSVIVALVFTIIGIVMTCVKNAPAVATTSDNQEDKQTKSTQDTNNNETPRFCRNCGCPTSEDARFCRYCGKDIK